MEVTGQLRVRALAFHHLLNHLLLSMTGFLAHELLGNSVSVFHLVIGTQGTYVTMPGSTWVRGIQTRVLMIVGHVLYPQNHLSTPISVFNLFILHAHEGTA